MKWIITIIFKDNVKSNCDFISHNETLFLATETLYQFIPIYTNKSNLYIYINLQKKIKILQHVTLFLIICVQISRIFLRTLHLTV